MVAGSSHSATRLAGWTGGPGHTPDRPRPGRKRALSLKTGAHPFSYRPSRWKGLREASLLRWHKIIVFQVLQDEVVIVSFYDARQDLGRVFPLPESH